MGWRSSDTAELSYVDVRVPVGNLVGTGELGFRADRAGIRHRTVGAGGAGLRQRPTLPRPDAAMGPRPETFGKPLIARQSVQNTLAEMARRVDVARTYVRAVVERKVAVESGEADGPDDLLAEVLREEHRRRSRWWWRTRPCSSSAGSGYMTGTEVERQYRDARIIGIGGGTTEILTALAAKRLGYQR